VYTPPSKSTPHPAMKAHGQQTSRPPTTDPCVEFMHPCTCLLLHNQAGVAARKKAARTAWGIGFNKVRPGHDLPAGHAAGGQRPRAPPILRREA
jgi:hypothetical protein